MKWIPALWIANLTGPVIWFASMQANFVLSPWACTLGWKPVLYVVSIVAMATVAVSGWFAYNQWQQLGREEPGESGGAIAASRALAAGGVGLSAMFFLIILAQAVVEIILGSCE